MVTVIQSEAKNLENVHVDVLLYVTEILPPFGRLNDNAESYSLLMLTTGFSFATRQDFTMTVPRMKAMATMPTPI